MRLPLVRPLLGTWSTTQACALSENRTRHPLVRRLALNPLSHTSQGLIHHLGPWVNLDGCLLFWVLECTWELCASHIIPFSSASGVRGPWCYLCLKSLMHKMIQILPAPGPSDYPHISFWAHMPTALAITGSLGGWKAQRYDHLAVAQDSISVYKSHIKFINWQAELVCLIFWYLNFFNIWEPLCIYDCFTKYLCLDSFFYMWMSSCPRTIFKRRPSIRRLLILY